MQLDDKQRADVMAAFAKAEWALLFTKTVEGEIEAQVASHEWTAETVEKFAEVLVGGIASVARTLESKGVVRDRWEVARWLAREISEAFEPDPVSN
jgi:hypothetical protein